jgi:hypothetical protein
MKLPSRMLDLSVPLDNETVLDPPIMRPKIDYKTNKENAWMLLECELARSRDPTGNNQIRYLPRRSASGPRAETHKCAHPIGFPPRFRMRQEWRMPLR